MQKDYKIKMAYELSGGRFHARTSKILDFGCGNGHFVSACLKQGIDAVGVDVKFKSGPMVDELIHENRIHQIGTKDSYTLPLHTSDFDIVVSEQVFEHVQNHDVNRPGFCRHLGAIL